jgi:hypothetical protein
VGFLWGSATVSQACGASVGLADALICPAFPIHGARVPQLPEATQRHRSGLPAGVDSAPEDRITDRYHYSGPRREDPHYLLAADGARLVPHLDAARSAAAQAAAIVYRQSARYLTPLDRLARTSQLELTAPPPRLPRPGRPHRGCRPRPALADPLVSWPPCHWPLGPHRPHQRGDYGDGRGFAGRHLGHCQRRQRESGWSRWPGGVGSGRTAMVCRLLKGLEADRIPEVPGRRPGDRGTGRPPSTMPRTGRWSRC